MFDIGKVAFDYKNLDYDEIIKEFEKIEESYDLLKEKINKYLPTVKSSSYKNISIIKEKINSEIAEK